MSKRTILEWHRLADIGDVHTVTDEVVRWGNTSFDMGFQLAVEDRQVLITTITYVGVANGTIWPKPPPAAIRAHLSG